MMMGENQGEKTRYLSKEKNSTWVIQNSQRISIMLGITFAGSEKQALGLFNEIEKRMMEKMRCENSQIKAKSKRGVEGSR